MVSVYNKGFSRNSASILSRLRNQESPALNGSTGDVQPHFLKDFRKNVYYGSYRNNIMGENRMNHHSRFLLTVVIYASILSPSRHAVLEGELLCV